MEQDYYSKLHEENALASSGVMMCADSHLYQSRVRVFHEDGIAVNEMPGVKPAFPKSSVIWMICECRKKHEGNLTA